MVKEYGYEYDSVLDDVLWKNTKGKVTNGRLLNALCLRSGRDALKAIAREYKSCVAYIPALACDSMVKPFEQYGHSVCFYKLKTDYSIDLDSLKLSDQPVLFLYMDYFGKTVISDYDLDRLRNRGNIVFIEDRTHNLIWERRSLFQPDYVIASLRKWIPVPDGGLLWGKITKPLSSDTSFSTTRLKAQCLRNRYLREGDETLKAEFRRIFSSVSDIMEKDEPSAMSAYSFSIAMNTDWAQIRKTRKENSEVLISVLETSPYIKFMQKKSGISDLYVAFTVPNRDVIQQRLSGMGIFNTIIWPLTEKQKLVCETAKYTEENMLAAPCDQRYTIEDMKHIGAEIVRVIANVIG